MASVSLANPIFRRAARLPVPTIGPCLSRFSCSLIYTTRFRKMHTNGTSLPPQQSEASESQFLDATNTTGSTPKNFISPPDKPEYHPYRLPIEHAEGSSNSSKDWQDGLELETATMLARQQKTPLRFLVLYGSLRQTSYSRLLAFEMARLLEVGQLGLAGKISY